VAAAVFGEQQTDARVSVLQQRWLFGAFCYANKWTILSTNAFAKA
jgi:hypothetical protein